MAQPLKELVGAKGPDASFASVGLATHAIAHSAEVAGCKRGSVIGFDEALATRTNAVWESRADLGQDRRVAVDNVKLAVCHVDSPFGMYPATRGILAFRRYRLIGRELGSLPA